MKNNNKFSRNERGQALIIITFAIIGLIGLTGLTVDGGMAYSDRRQAQNAADSAAFAAALAHVRGTDLEQTAQNIATTNGYDDNGVSNDVSISWVDSPSGVCPVGTTDNLDITVDIVSHIDTTFAAVVGIRQMTNTVTATTRVCGVYIAPIFGGNAIVSLNDGNSPCAYFSGDSNSAKWTITGGGLFSNGCAESKNSNSVDLDDDQCVSTVDNSATGFDSGDVCSGNASPYDSEYVDSIMPANPCDGDPGDIGVTPTAAQLDGTAPFTNDVYCIDNMDALDGNDVVLENATLYVTDNDFDLKFAGGGGFSGTPTNTGEYSSYSIIVADNGSPCPDFTPPGNIDAQVMEYRGNGSGVLYGTILAPTACIDLRGNAGSGSNDDPLIVNSQIIAWNVSSNGNATVTVNYVDDQNRRDPVDPTLQLLK